MAIVIPEIDLTVYHPVKTGGTWLKAFLRDNGIPFYLTFPSMFEGGFERVVCNKWTTHHLAVGSTTGKTIYLTRDIIAWYRSFFIHKRNITNPDEAWGTHEFDVGIKESVLESFDKFLAAVKDKFQHGFAISYFEAYDTVSDDGMGCLDASYLIAYEWNALKPFINIHWPAPRNTARESITLSEKQISEINEYEGL